MMRRATGVLLVIGTCAAALLATRTAGPALPGRPVAAAVPAALQVGQCVIARADEVLPVDCSAAHVGEVVAVFTTPAGSARKTASTDTSACQVPASSYLGLDQVSPGNDRGNYLTTSFGIWRPTDTGSLRVVGPGPRQSAAGQLWSACVLTGRAAAPDVVGSAGAGTYRGTSRNALDGGILPEPFAVCDATSVFSRQPADCTQPHPAELLGITPVTSQLGTPASLQSSCDELAAYLTKMPDPTAGGRLVVTVRTLTYEAAAVPVQAWCGIETVPEPGRVSGEARLIGSLVGLGDAPAPLR